MATSKPISSISYNTEEFLQGKLAKMVEAGIISFWAYIRHNGESKQEDEAAGKDHIHLLIIPNKCVDMVNIGKEFVQFYANDPKHPLRCMPFRTSKTDDWILYALHEPEYIILHGMEKAYIYDVTDFVASDDDYLHQLWVEAKQSLANNPAVKIRKKARDGMRFADLVRSGAISIQQIRNAELYFSYMQEGSSMPRQTIYLDNGLIVLPNGDIERAQQHMDGFDELNLNINIQ